MVWLCFNKGKVFYNIYTHSESVVIISAKPKGYTGKTKLEIM